MLTKKKINNGIMTNERPKGDTSENLFSDKPHEVVGKLEISFNKINNKLTNLLEENQELKQQYKNIQQQHQEILKINSELNEKLQEKVKKLENVEQYVLNLEKQKNKEIQRLEILSQNLENNLNILELEEINENDIEILKKSLIDK